MSAINYEDLIRIQSGDIRKEDYINYTEAEINALVHGVGMEIAKEHNLPLKEVCEHINQNADNYPLAAQEKIRSAIINK